MLTLHSLQGEAVARLLAAYVSLFGRLVTHACRSAGPAVGATLSGKLSLHSLHKLVLQSAEQTGKTKWRHSCSTQVHSLLWALPPPTSRLQCTLGALRPLRPLGTLSALSSPLRAILRLVHLGLLHGPLRGSNHSVRLIRSRSLWRWRATSSLTPSLVRRAACVVHLRLSTAAALP